MGHRSADGKGVGLHEEGDQERVPLRRQVAGLPPGDTEAGAAWSTACAPPQAPTGQPVTGTCNGNSEPLVEDAGGSATTDTWDAANDLLKIQQSNVGAVNLTNT